MQSLGLTGKTQGLALPHLWAPLLVLAASLAMTAFTAQVLDQQTQKLSENIYRQQHKALVSRLKGYTGLTSLSANSAPAVEGPASVQLWLATVFKGEVPDSVNMRIDTLARHTKTPLFQVIHTTSPDRSRSLRSEVSVGDHRWLLTTLPAKQFFERPARQSSRLVWLTGLTIAVVATGIVTLLCLRIRRWKMHYQRAEERFETDEQQINNMQVEKSILRQALNDSEQRSRDLVALSGAAIGELDEKALTGYISPQVADLLQVAPADLAGQPFEQLVDPECLDNFQRTLQAARQEQQIQRIDLKLLCADGQRVPVTLRVLALQDTLHGFSGYRLSLQANPHGF